MGNYFANYLFSYTGFRFVDLATGKGSALFITNTFPPVISSFTSGLVVRRLAGDGLPDTN